MAATLDEIKITLMKMMIDMKIKIKKNQMSIWEKM